MRRALTATGLALAAIAFVPVFVEAILVAPHAVFIDHRSRTGQMYLVNTGTVPEEVSVELQFGFPDSDSLGGVYIRFDGIQDTSLSAAGWVRAFPRRMVVQPGERQTVRLLAQPPLGLGDGEYWSRLIVTSREVRPGMAATDTVVRAGVDMQIRTILPLSYRKGALRTSVTMTEFQAEMRGDSMVVWLGLHRDGNAAYIGKLELDAHDQAGRAVGSLDGPVAVYFHVRRRFAFPVTGATRGANYVVRVRLSTERDDVRRDDVIQAAAVVDSALVRAQ